VSVHRPVGASFNAHERLQTIGDSPCCFTALARRVSDGDDNEGGIFRVVALYQSKAAFRKEPLAGLILAARWYSSSYAHGSWRKTYQLGEVELDAPVLIFKAQLSFLRVRKHPEEEESFVGSAEQLLGRSELESVRLHSLIDAHSCSTVNRCSRSFEGSVDGEKCSFLITVCRIMYSRSRPAVTLDSADPAEVRVAEVLLGYESCAQRVEVVYVLLECTAFNRPVPARHIERVYEE
jgi:hypothetical protein